ncbi:MULTISPECIES: PRD domain-containing protein [Mammaliicoccus]|uniref:PRD domain-containing protein n=1 Tax=Mammaliicoccus lentus TaxID=42858 RepID=A0ABS6GVR6_MAMLE|nr:PRD domain-containing protein [Mammaliicoccus lentus]MBF0840720.1 PRD domain-containing protein [Mammaliicoccus lentus]MBU6113519.1 PRD domain-containing protein [Mammaliicoccus lentus]MBW0762611.1 PRD domain-containing protein [Mammaliicoccus lentus]MCR1872087.1 PRD domain-containing protein [Mammaliicoccus lentus]
MKINKVLNNNLVISNINGKERIVMGNGIAFGKKRGQKLDESKIEKLFRLTTTEQEKMLALIDEVDDNVVLITEKIIQKANELYENAISESLYLSLIDHINFAIERTKNGYVIKNPLMHEIRKIYPQEYQIGEFGVNLINKEYNIDIQIDEASFIAMHIVNTNLGESLSNTYEITKITTRILDLINSYFDLDLLETDLNYSRFMTHLKFFIQRLINRDPLEEVMDDTLIQILTVRYSEENKCVDEIAKLLKEEYDHELLNDERGYLILHLARLLKSNM